MVMSSVFGVDEGKRRCLICVVAGAYDIVIFSTRIASAHTPQATPNFLKGRYIWTGEFWGNGVPFCQFRQCLFIHTYST